MKNFFITLTAAFAFCLFPVMSVGVKSGDDDILSRHSLICQPYRSVSGENCDIDINGDFAIRFDFVCKLPAGIGIYSENTNGIL